MARVPTSSHGGQSDPDVLVARSGRRGVEEVLAAAKPLTEFLIDDAVQRHADGLGVQAPVEHKLAVLRALMPFVLAAPEGLPRATFERAVARRLGIDIGPMRQRTAAGGPHRAAREPSMTRSSTSSVADPRSRPPVAVVATRRG